MVRCRFVGYLITLLVVVLIAPAIGVIQGGAQEVGTPVAAENQAEHGVLAAWTQIGVDDQVHARVVVIGECPEIVIDGTPLPTTIRAEPSDAFPVTVCEAELPEGAEIIAVGDRVLHGSSADPQRIAAIGDTGCRIAEEFQQDCHNPDAWPLARLAAQTAAWQPDLVVHTGDYLYRETECPEANAGCAGSPWGDTWATWQADFVEPARSLLEAAPWVFVRGNHEMCGRSADGWFRLFDPAPYQVECQQYTDPFRITIGDQVAIVLDAAAAQDIDPEPESIAVYQEQFALVEELAGDSGVWLFSHKSFWSLGTDWEGGALEWTTGSFIEAENGQPPAGIELLIGGHVHMAQVLLFSEESERPTVLITGNGGTLLEAFDAGVFTGADIADEALVEGFSYLAHGFLGLERVDGGWVATLNQLDGPPLATCLLIEKQGSCLRAADPG